MYNAYTISHPHFRFTERRERDERETRESPLRETRERPSPGREEPAAANEAREKNRRHERESRGRRRSSSEVESPLTDPGIALLGLIGSKHGAVWLIAHRFCDVVQMCMYYLYGWVVICVLYLVCGVRGCKKCIV